MSSPDFREWAELEPDTATCNDRMRELYDRGLAAGCTVGRAVILEAHGTTWLCVDGWRVPPADQGAEPTAADIPAGFV